MPTVAVRVDGHVSILPESQRVLLLIIRHDGFAGHREADQSPGLPTEILSNSVLLSRRAAWHPNAQSEEGNRHNSSCAYEGVFSFHLLLQSSTIGRVHLPQGSRY